MATVKMVFAGDASQLNKSFESIEANSKVMAKTVDAQSKKVEGAFDRMAEASDNSEGKFMGVADVLDGLSTAMGLNIGPAIEMSRAMGDLSGGFAQIGPLIGKFGAALAGLALNPVVLAIAAIGLALVVAYKKSETFRNIVNGVFQSIKQVVGPIIDGIGRALSWVGGLFGKAGDDSEEMSDDMKAAAERSQQAWDTWKGNVAQALDSIVDPLDRARENSKVTLDEIKTNLDDNVKFYSGWINNLKSLTQRGFGELANYLYGLGPTAEKAVGEAYKMTDPQLKKLQDNIVGKLDTAGKVGAQVLVDGIGGKDYAAIGQTVGEQLASGFEHAFPPGSLGHKLVMGDYPLLAPPASQFGTLAPKTPPAPHPLTLSTIPPVPTAPAPTLGPPAPAVTTNNVTVNVGGSNANPADIGRRIVWELN